MPSFSLPARGRRLSGLIGFALIVFSAILPGSVAGAQPDNLPSPSSVGAVDIHPTLAAQLSSGVRRARDHSVAPGLSVAAVAADGTSWAASAGTFQSGRPIQPHDAVTIGSVTKSFTAAVVLALAHEGRIDLDAPVAAYLADPGRAAGRTVRQLLNHTSGIADLYGPARAHLNGAPHLSLSANGVLKPVGTEWFAAGTGYAYSNTNYYILGLLIEAVVGHSFAEEVAARFTRPLGLAKTRMLTGPGVQLPPAWSSVFWTSGAMEAPPSELARWGHALYGGAVLAEPSLAAMLDFSAGHDYGLGAQLLPLGERSVPGHSGLMYETTTLLVHLPEGLTVAIAATMPHTDLEAALVTPYDGGPSLLELLAHL